MLFFAIRIAQCFMVVFVFFSYYNWKSINWSTTMIIAGFQKTTLLDYPGQTASLIFTAGCNMRCPYCQNGELVENISGIEPIPEEEVLEHLKKRKGLITGLCISGGEPTLWFGDRGDGSFIKAVKALGINVKLDTNGTNPAVLSELISEGLLDYVAMDIKTSLEKYDMFFKDVEKIEESVKILMTSHIPFEFRTTVCDGLFTEDDAKRIAKWIRGDEPYFLQPYRETETVLNPIYKTPSKEMMERYVEIMRSDLPKVKIRG